MSTTNNTAVNGGANETFGKESRRTKPWITKDVFNLCDMGRDLKKRLYKTEGVKRNREAYKRI